MQISPDYAKLVAEDYIEAVPLDRFHDMKEGDCFDLGGIIIENAWYTRAYKRLACNVA